MFYEKAIQILLLFALNVTRFRGPFANGGGGGGGGWLFCIEMMKMGLFWKGKQS